jgi:hypothetical protein
MNCLIVEHRYHAQDVARRVADTMVSGVTGAQVLVGLAAIIFGIVALAGVYPLTLSLVALTDRPAARSDCSAIPRRRACTGDIVVKVSLLGRLAAASFDLLEVPTLYGLPHGRSCRS